MQLSPVLSFTQGKLYSGRNGRSPCTCYLSLLIMVYYFIETKERSYVITTGKEADQIWGIFVKKHQVNSFKKSYVIQFRT